MRLSSNFRNIQNIENKLTRFQVYQETELACKYKSPLHKTQYSEILVEYANGFDMTTGQIKEYNTKIATRQNTYDEEHNNVETTPTAPQLPPLPHNHPLSLVPRNFRNLAITYNPNFRPTISQSPIQHIMTHQSQDDNTYEQIIEQPHTTAFQSQNNNFFSPR